MALFGLKGFEVEIGIIIIIQAKYLLTILLILKLNQNRKRAPPQTLMLIVAKRPKKGP